MARGGGKPKGRLAVRLALALAGLAFVVAFAAVALAIQPMVPALRPQETAVTGTAWLLGGLGALLTGVAVAIAATVLGNQISQRVGDLTANANRLGRGGAEAKFRAAGNDEVAALGRALQGAAAEFAAQQAERERGGGGNAGDDAQVRQFRDRTLPEGFAAVPGLEVDGALLAGARGGLDYFDLVSPSAGKAPPVLYLVSAEGQGALAVLACRAARDELLRALQTGLAPAAALASANKALKAMLPPLVCCKATLLELAGDEARLYQAGARSPLLICARGEVLELAAEGLALGLDAGPVFEKSLRPQSIALTPGTRLVLCNEAALRAPTFLDLLGKHSARHTAMFMNMVLGGLEQDAGGDGVREDVVLMTVKKGGQS